MANDYKSTMNLPKTEFPMRAGLATKEPLRLARWEEADIYALSLEKNEGKETFILHDGPPYANGPIHMGHALNKILKDIINKYWTSRGYQTPYVPGWDCHGQPIEHMVEVTVGKERIAQMDQVTIRRLCREWAEKYVDSQREGFKRLGVRGKWEDPYLTYQHAYEAADIEIFKRIFLDGAIYRGRKPIHWCRSCHTALAEAEIEYGDEPGHSLYVGFEIEDGFAPLLASGLTQRLAIWTTTPWTLPANAAVAVSADAEYVAVVHGSSAYIMAKALVAQVVEAAQWEGATLVTDAKDEPLVFKGKDLEGLTYVHPIIEGRSGVVVVGDHVLLDGGTGAVHTAPGHGQEDYEVGLEYDLPLYMPVDGAGIFTEEAGAFAGMDIDEAAEPIIEHLGNTDQLIIDGSLSHSYPHCWRCKNPVIFRATEQWFVSMEATGLREKALSAMQDVTWHPAWAVNRIGSMVADRPDWTISRQRNWGVPIPVFSCKSCGTTLATEESFDAVIALFHEHGSDAWFSMDPSEYLPATIACEKCGSHEFIPEKDILDVWWESGCSHTGVLEVYPELRRPADMYLEGSDQHRGWFQSSLLTSVAAYGEAPYRNVVSNGFIVDEQGRKMSKSLGNGVDPLEVCDKRGADIIRLWVSSTDSSQDVSISEGILDRTSDAYRRFRNTLRFLLSVLDDFDGEKDAVALDEMLEVDRWQVARLTQLEATVREGYETYRFHQVYRALYDYIVTELSSVYMDALKDRLYSDAADSKTRRSGQTAAAEILQFLVRVLSPIITFTADEVFEHMPVSLREPGVEFAQLLDWYEPRFTEEEAAPLLARYRSALNVRDVVTKALEDARGEDIIGKSQEARVTVTAPQGLVDVLLAEPTIDYEEFFIVAGVEFQPGEELAAHVEPAVGEKCPRCWNVRELGVSEAYPEVCGRCAEVLAGLEAR